MTRDLVTISSGATLLEAHWLMVENNIRRLPVVEAGKVVGIITESDIFRALVQLWPR